MLKLKHRPITRCADCCGSSSGGATSVDGCGSTATEGTPNFGASGVSLLFWICRSNGPRSTMSHSNEPCSNGAHSNRVTQQLDHTVIRHTAIKLHSNWITQQLGHTAIELYSNWITQPPGHTATGSHSNQVTQQLGHTARMLTETP